LAVSLTPILKSSAQDSAIGLYNEREYGKGNVTLTAGETQRVAQFNYSTYDPAILVLDLAFRSWKSSGNLTMLINGRVFASVFASPESPTVSLRVISFSGTEWVRPPSPDSFVFGNEISFSSKPENGFAGTFEYEIRIRGSR